MIILGEKRSIDSGFVLEGQGGLLPFPETLFTPKIKNNRKNNRKNCLLSFGPLPPK